MAGLGMRGKRVHISKLKQVKYHLLQKCQKTIHTAHCVPVLFQAPEESDEDDLCALSDRWEYQKTVRRWSRKLEPEVTVTDLNLEASSSHDSLLGEESGSHTDESPVLESKMPHTTSTTPTSTVVGDPAPDSKVLLDVGPTTENPVIQPDSNVSSFPISPKLRRAASERLKSALKKMESFKKKSKKYPTNRHLEISDPVVSDQEGMQAKLDRLNCVDISPTREESTPIPASTPELPSPQEESTPLDKLVKPSPEDSALSVVSPISPAPPQGSAADESSSSDTLSAVGESKSLSEYYTAHNQLLASFQNYSGRDQSQPYPGPGARKNSDSSLVEIFLLPQDHKPGSFPRLLKNGYIDTAAPFQASAPGSQTLPCPTLQGAQAPVSRFSVYDNLGGGSPQRSVSGPGLHKQSMGTVPEGPSSDLHNLTFPCIQEGGQPQQGRPESAGMVRSRSASATTSLERQALLGRGLDEIGMSTSFRSGHRKSSSTMEEFDMILQNLYRDISNLNRAIGQEERHSRDLDLDPELMGSGVGRADRDVSFSIEEHNEDSLSGDLNTG